MTKPKRSTVIRLLDSRHIPYQTSTYATDIRSAEEVAHELSILAHEVYKTLVVLPPHSKPLWVIIPEPCALDPKRLAQALGARKLRTAMQREAEELTRLQVGGIAALALLHGGFLVHVDQAAQALTAFVVSAGQREKNLRQRPDDFIAMTHARFVDASIDRDTMP
jgi:Cys-tRNA(Pro)/Cys-tRNA(Cys) deacylase